MAEVEEHTHEPMDMAENLSEFMYCARGVLYYLLYPLRALPLCELGWHRWCSCCSPMTCTRCGTAGPD